MSHVLPLLSSLSSLSSVVSLSLLNLYSSLLRHSLSSYIMLKQCIYEHVWFSVIASVGLAWYTLIFVQGCNRVCVIIGSGHARLSITVIYRKTRNFGEWKLWRIWVNRQTLTYQTSKISAFLLNNAVIYAINFTVSWTITWTNMEML